LCQTPIKRNVTRGADGALLDRQADAKDLIPGFADRDRVDALADVAFQQHIGIDILEDVQAPILQVAQSRGEALAEDAEHAEDMIVGAAGIDIVLFNLEPAFVAIEPVQSIGGLDFGRADRQNMVMAASVSRPLSSMSWAAMIARRRPVLKSLASQLGVTLPSRTSWAQRSG
jgi:hypothetical protein